MWWTISIVYNVFAHKNGSEVRVLVDVHVAQVNQQSYHAIQEAHNPDADEELHGGCRVSHQVRGCDWAIANSGVSINEQDLAQPVRDTAKSHRKGGKKGLLNTTGSWFVFRGGTG